MTFFDLVKRRLKLRHHLCGNGVALFRPVQRDGREISCNFEEKCGIHFVKTPPQSTSGACAYFARISFVISSTFLKRAESTPGSAPAFRSAARISSVAMFPTRLSPANGQPPSPVSAPSNRRQVAVMHCPPYPQAKPFAPEYLLATPKCPPQSPTPTARHKDSQTPSKYKSPDRSLPLMFLSATFRPAIAIRPWTCWHSPGENMPRWSKDIRSSSRQESPAPAAIPFHSQRFQEFPTAPCQREGKH